MKEFITMLREYRRTIHEKTAKKLDLDTSERIIQKITSNSAKCKECKNHVNEFQLHFTQLMDKKDDLAKEDFKHHSQKVSQITTHLRDKHKLITDGYYLSIGISLGVSLGVVLGLLLFDNIGLGIPIGMAIGIGVGTNLDSRAKKKGLTI